MQEKVNKNQMLLMITLNNSSKFGNRLFVAVLHAEGLAGYDAILLSPASQAQIINSLSFHRIIFTIFLARFAKSVSVPFMRR